jgi:cellobiose-specific phosphotransferase system component IIA
MHDMKTGLDVVESTFPVGFLEETIMELITNAETSHRTALQVLNAAKKGKWREVDCLLGEPVASSLGKHLRLLVSLVEKIE